jgi:hypothetical protein
VAVPKKFWHTKRWCRSSEFGFCAGTKVFEEPKNAIKFLDWLKKSGPAQNILEPVDGQCIKNLPSNHSKDLNFNKLIKKFDLEAQAHRQSHFWHPIYDAKPCWKYEKNHGSPLESTS